MKANKSYASIELAFQFTFCLEGNKNTCVGCHYFDKLFDVIIDNSVFDTIKILRYWLLKTLTKTFFPSNIKLKPTVVQEVLLGLVFTHVGHLSLNPEGDQQR